MFRKIFYFKNSCLWLHLAKDLWYDYNHTSKTETTYVFGMTIKETDGYKAFSFYFFTFKLCYLVSK